MRVLWTHNFNPQESNGGCFMYTAAKGLRNLGVELHIEYLGNLKYPIRIAEKRKYIRSLADKFDIVHAQYASACAFVTSAVVDRPTVVTIRGNDWTTHDETFGYIYLHGSSQNLMGIKFHITAPFRFAYPVFHSKRGFLSGSFRSHETLEQSPLATEFYCSNLPTQHCLLCV